MEKNSILLALDGSIYSRYAAELSWKLSEQIGAGLSAMHVVDTKNAWDFIGHDKPGFLTKSAYSGAHDGLTLLLYALGQKLSNAYFAETAGRALASTFEIVEGSPVEEICKKAIWHDLVVIGHKPYENNAAQRSRKFMRLSTAESLAHDCPVPLLVLQSECPSWTSMTILVSMDHINELYINSCLKVAQVLGVQPAVVALSTGVTEEPVEAFIADLRGANVNLHNVPIIVTRYDGPAEEAAHGNVDAIEGLGIDDWNTTLLVIPTREFTGQRLTVMGGSPSMFVRFLGLPAILLWPEEYCSSVEKPASERVVELRK